MSRYRIDAKEDKFAVVVGWDNPLQTFFAQVTDTTVDEDEEEAMVLWCGAAPGDDVLTVEDLQVRLGNYAVIPPEVATKLRQEYEGRTEPSPLQKLAKNIFGNLQ